MIYWTIEGFAKVREWCEQMIDWVVEVVAWCEVDDGGREVINGMIEGSSYAPMGSGKWKKVDWSVTKDW